MTARHDPLRRATRTQSIAADPRLSAWVSASAGSGKTKVLIDRFVRLLLAGTLPQKILCLTYTQAAAAEMIARVTERLSRWAVCPEETLDAELVALTHVRQAAQLAPFRARARALFAAVLDCPGGLRIKTFHAFAQEILARFPLEAGVAPHFTVLEESAALALREAALADLLANGPAAAQAAWAALVGALTVDKVQELLRQALHDAPKLTALCAQYPTVEALHDALYRHALLDPAQTSEQLLAAFCATPRLPHDMLTQYAALKQAGGKPDVAAALQGWLALPVAARVACFSDYQTIFLTDKLTPRAKLLLKAEQDAQPELAVALGQEAAAIQTVRETCNRLQRAATTAQLLTLARAQQESYAARKAQAAALDFDDVIAQTAMLLARAGVAPWVLWKLDGGLDHIMIDEAQDTSPLQWRIIKALTAEFFAGQGAARAGRTLFVVGDEKQSIYSFQHADPSQFHAMRAFFAAQIKAARQRFVALQLDVSFRSAPRVLQQVDAVFAPPGAQAGVSAVPVRHSASRTQTPGWVSFWPLQTPSDRAVGTVWQVPDDYSFMRTPVAALAEQLAQQIADWLAAQRPVAVREGGGETVRPLRPGDIMVLVRRRNALVPALIRALKARQVPVSGVDRLLLRDALCVKDLLALIQFALLPEDDLNLACVLRGPFIGLDETALEEACVARPESLWQQLQQRPEHAASVHWLRAVLARADYGSSYDFLSLLLQQPCPAGVSGKQVMLARLGHDILDPLDALLNQAQRFGLQQPDSLQHFLQCMLRDEAEIKRALEQQAGEVRIMTVHAAKGLQAPLVLLPDTTGAPRAQELSMLQWDAETGLPYYCGGAAETRDMLAEQLLQTARTAQLQEYRRLLYVALTRAESELHIHGYHGAKLPQAFDESWYECIRRGCAVPDDATAAPGQPLREWRDAGLAAKPAATARVATPVPLPDWATRPAMPENVVRPLNPSQLGADEVAASPSSAAGQQSFRRGRLMHQLLQYLPDLPAAQQDAIARQFLAAQGAEAAEVELLAEEALRLLRHPAYAALFAPGSRAEVPLMGWVTQPDGTAAMVSGQLDRLVVTATEVLVLDYKTNRPPPTAGAPVPLAYRRQMAAYRAILRQIYPRHQVRCFLLWTYNASLQEVPDETEGLAANNLAIAGK